jgi:hypothetical protein
LVVNRPLRDVAATFRERASACLQTVTRSERSSFHSTHVAITEMTYTPTVVEADGRVELHLQAKQTVAIEIGPASPKGFYTFVAVATALDPRRTQLEIWYALLGAEPLRAAVKGWASGSFSGCPDLS